MSVPPTSTPFDAAWREHRPYLQAIASRMLGDAVEAEDVVQDAFGRLAQHDFDAIEDARGWLVVVVRRLCLDRLRSAHHRRETATASVPEEEQPPTSSGRDPADRVTLDDEIQLALGFVLDRLTPAERSSFVLHDIFGFSFEAVGQIVGRSATACRQLASRARRSVRAAPLVPRPTGEHRTLTERFIDACAGGDLAALMELLDPDVAGTGMVLGGAHTGSFKGRARVARGLLYYLGPKSVMTLVPAPLEVGVGLVAYRGGKAVALIHIETAGDRVHHITAYLTDADSADIHRRAPDLET